MSQEFARWMNVETKLSAFAKTIKHATPITSVKKLHAQVMLLIHANKKLKELPQNHSIVSTSAQVETARDAQIIVIVVQVTSVTSQVTYLLSAIRNAQLHMNVREKVFIQHVILKALESVMAILVLTKIVEEQFAWTTCANLASVHKGKQIAVKLAFSALHQIPIDLQTQIQRFTREPAMLETRLNHLKTL
jgi:hypothetical protein